MLKLFLAGYAEFTYELLVDYGLFGELFPASAAALKANPDYTDSLIRNALINTDLRSQQKKTVTPACLFAALHNHLASFAPLVVLGIVFSLAYERTGRIGTAIVAHALFNSYSVLRIFIDPSAN